MPILQSPLVQQYLRDHAGPAEAALRQQAQSLAHQAYAPFSPESTLSYQGGQSLVNLAQSRPWLAPVGDFVSGAADNPLRAGLAGALAGSLGGALLGGLRGGDITTSAALGGLGGGTLSALLGALMRSRQNTEAQKNLRTFGKIASAVPSGIKSKLESANLPWSTKAQLSEMVSQLDPELQNQLSRLLSTVTGASVAMLIAKFLLGAGFNSSILMGLIGGGIGYAMGGRNQPSTDLFGNRRLVQ